jgi:UTP--glucose-1-phosphate uridylyltransferase
LKKIHTAVIPAAGLGSRFLPATKCCPKELIPVLRKPLLQYVVEECVAAGIDDIILVVGRGKPSLEKHFRRNESLESYLEARGKGPELELLRRLSNLATFRSIEQPAPLGLAHAIGCARALTGEEPFAVLLPDVLFTSRVPCIAQLIEAHEAHGGCVLAMREIEPHDCERYGVVAGDPVGSGGDRQLILRVRQLREKPKPANAPSLYGIAGRYVLAPDVFSYIDRTVPDPDGEIQLTQTLQMYAMASAVFSVLVEGSEYDAGDLLGFLRATVEYALRDPEIAGAFRAYLAHMKFID